MRHHHRGQRHPVMLAALLLLSGLAQGAPSVEVLAREARDDFQAGRFAQAREKLMEAVKASPRNPALWSFLGLADAQLNNLDAAISDFHKTLDLAPDDAQSFFNLGLLYGRKNETAKAMDAYQQGLKLDPRNAAANQNYALLLIAQKQFREAIRPLETLREVDTRNLSVRMALVACYAKSGMGTEVGKEIRSIVDFPGLTADATLRLAKALLEAGQPEPAQIVLEHAVKISPGMAEAHYDLGLLFLNKSLYEDAVRELGRAAQIDPESA